MTLGHKHVNIIKHLNTTLRNNSQIYRTIHSQIKHKCLSYVRQRRGDCLTPSRKVPGYCPNKGYFQGYYLSVNNIFDNQHISTIVDFVNCIDFVNCTPGVRGGFWDFEICCETRSKFSNAFVLTENKVSHLKISCVTFWGLTEILL